MLTPVHTVHAARYGLHMSPTNVVQLSTQKKWTKRSKRIPYLECLFHVFLRYEHQAACRVSARRGERVSTRPGQGVHLTPAPVSPLSSTAFTGRESLARRTNEAGLDCLVRSKVQSARWHRTQHRRWNAGVYRQRAPSSVIVAQGCMGDA